MLDGPQNEGVMKILRDAPDERLRTIKSAQNQGLARSLNRLADIATGIGYDFYARMDADDIALPRRFETEILYLMNHPDIDVVGSACLEIDTDGRELRRMSKPSSNSELKAGLAIRNPFVHPTVIMRGKIFEAGFRYPTDGHLVEDYGMWVSLQRAGFIFANLDEPTLWFRHDTSFLHRRRGLRHAWGELVVRARSLTIPGVSRIAGASIILATFLAKLLPTSLLGLIYKIHRNLYSQGDKNLA
jgi:hypothetical protein